MSPDARDRKSADFQSLTEKPDCEDSESLLKRKGLAAKLDCSLRTIDNLQASGMPCIYIGRSRRFVFSEVLAWLKRRGAKR